MIAHIAVGDKFIEPFIQFIENHFDSKDHLFLISPMALYKVKPRSNVVMLDERMGRLRKMAEWSKAMNKADKIILHGLFDIRIINLLCLQPWLLKKCYWVMWGGDLYHFKLRGRGIRSDIQEAKRAFVIKRMGHLVTYIKGDYELAQKWYGAKGEYHNCLMYPSNLYKEYAMPPKQGDAINILVGNSADPTNSHVEIFEKLKPYRDQNIQIVCPLSYGHIEYAERIAELGKELFGDKFKPLIDFMPFEKYLEFLGKIDIAVFAHKRQQAMGNMTTLLGLGKKVYLRSDVTPWEFYSKLGVKVFDVDGLELLPIHKDEATRNRQIVAGNFSHDALVAQLREIFK